LFRHAGVAAVDTVVGVTAAGMAVDTAVDTLADTVTVLGRVVVVLLKNRLERYWHP
jgi:hypothetical protein